ncbi:hypothetical protein [Alicyclobacillus sp. SO9]|uniref:hypothetical protein n=1 Tax=Alicyclobacillus sp. SO9 TaxID=2665646 RepID=UPI0018E82E17|nr:hypothetical protein [Alicyclobacillus sp. SO9]
MNHREALTEVTEQLVSEGTPLYNKPILYVQLRRHLTDVLMELKKGEEQVNFPSMNMDVSFSPQLRRYQFTRDNKYYHNLLENMALRLAPQLFLKLARENAEIVRIQENYRVDRDLANDIFVRASLHAGGSKQKYQNYVRQLVSICQMVATEREIMSR